MGTRSRAPWARWTQVGTRSRALRKAADVAGVGGGCVGRQTGTRRRPLIRLLPAGRPTATNPPGPCPEKSRRPERLIIAIAVIVAIAVIRIKVVIVIIIAIIVVIDIIVVVIDFM